MSRDHGDMLRVEVACQSRPSRNSAVSFTVPRFSAEKELRAAEAPIDVLIPDVGFLTAREVAERADDFLAAANAPSGPDIRRAVAFHPGPAHRGWRVAEVLLALGAFCRPVQGQRRHNAPNAPPGVLAKPHWPETLAIGRGNDGGTP